MHTRKRLPNYQLLAIGYFNTLQHARPKTIRRNISSLQYYMFDLFKGYIISRIYMKPSRLVILTQHGSTLVQPGTPKAANNIVGIYAMQFLKVIKFLIILPNVAGYCRLNCGTFTGLVHVCHHRMLKPYHENTVSILRLYQSRILAGFSY